MSVPCIKNLGLGNAKNHFLEINSCVVSRNSCVDRGEKYTNTNKPRYVYE